MSLRGSLSPDRAPSAWAEAVGAQGHMPPTAEQRGLDHALLKDQQQTSENNKKLQ